MDRRRDGRPACPVPPFRGSGHVLCSGARRCGYRGGRADRRPDPSDQGPSARAPGTRLAPAHEPAHRRSVPRGRVGLPRDLLRCAVRPVLRMQWSARYPRRAPSAPGRRSLARSPNGGGRSTCARDADTPTGRGAIRPRSGSRSRRGAKVERDPFLDRAIEGAPSARPGRARGSAPGPAGSGDSRTIRPWSPRASSRSPSRGTTSRVGSRTGWPSPEDLRPWPITDHDGLVLRLGELGGHGVRARFRDRPSRVRGPTPTGWSSSSRSGRPAVTWTWSTGRSR